MKYEMPVGVGNNSAKVFLQGGFFHSKSVTYAIHKHKYAEIHVVSAGNILFSANGKEYPVPSGCAFCIPGGTFHKCISAENIEKTDFQTDLIFTDCMTVKLPKGIAGGLLEAIKGKSELIGSYLSLICSSFGSFVTKPVPIRDRAFIIDEFFANNYSKDISCLELSRELCLSKKQTERLVEKYTGNNFRDEIRKRRLEAAKRLELETGGKISLNEIAVRVGYKSYSGFWKARKSAINGLSAVSRQLQEE